MEIKDGYLSDEELEQLILEVEENELVSAPPGFMEDVLIKTEAWQTMQNEAREGVTLECTKTESERQKGIRQESAEQECIKSKNGKQEIRKENKVIEFHKYCIRVITSAAAAIAILFALPSAEPVELHQIPTRQELVGRCVTREEVLDDTGFLTKFMDGLTNRIGGILNETEKEK